MKCVAAWLNNNDARTQRAQQAMMESLFRYGMEPVIVNGSPRPLLTEMLTLARSLTPDDGAFAWVNSDCAFLLPPAHPTGRGVTGYHRIEDDGSICLGVDAYVFTAEAWDAIYAPDLPSMYCGGTHVDWWLTRLAQKHGIYSSAVGLRHPSHAKSAASAGHDNHGQHNLREFHAWAARNNVGTAYE